MPTFRTTSGSSGTPPTSTPLPSRPVTANSPPDSASPPALPDALASEAVPTPTDREMLTALATIHDRRDWAGVVAFTDDWLAAYGTMPAYACHFRAAGLQGVRRYDEALLWAALACKAMPNARTPDERTQWVASRIGLGQAYARLGRYAEAKRVFRAALKIAVTDPDARVAQGHLRLCLKPGSWRRAWADHEARIGTDRAPRMPGIPEWDGGPTDGPVVVLHEQGIGDAILFARWLPWVAEQSGHPVLWAGPAFLHRWMLGLPGVGDCLDVSDALLTTDPSGDTLRLAKGSAIVRAMSLPALAKTTPETLPEPVYPYIGSYEASPISTRRSLTPAQRIAHGQPLRVGVCWAGATGGHHDFERSVPAEHFAHVWAPPLPNVEYVSLQYATEPPPGAPFGPMPPGDISDTGSRVASCDLVVSVDTSVVHIAGSLGVPTICLTPTTPDWRYADWPDGTTTPFYPSVVVVRRDHAAATEDQVRTARAIAEGYVRALAARIT